MIILFDDNINNTTTINGNTAYKIYRAIDDIQDIPHRIDGNGKYWVLKEDGTDNIHLPLTLFATDKITENSVIRADIKNKKDKEDDIGDLKYYITKVLGNWKLYEKDSWQEKEETPYG